MGLDGGQYNLYGAHFVPNAVDPSGLLTCHILVLGGHGAFWDRHLGRLVIGGWIEVQIERWEEKKKLRCDVVGVGIVCCFSKQICERKKLPKLGIPLHDGISFISKSEMINAIMKAKGAANRQCGKKTCGSQKCTRISVHIECDADMKSVLGEDANKYCKTFVYDCKKVKWKEPWP